MKIYKVFHPSEDIGCNELEEELSKIASKEWDIISVIYLPTHVYEIIGVKKIESQKLLSGEKVIYKGKKYITGNRGHGKVDLYAETGFHRCVDQSLVKKEEVFDDESEIVICPKCKNPVGSMETCTVCLAYMRKSNEWSLPQSCHTCPVVNECNERNSRGKYGTRGCKAELFDYFSRKTKIKG